MKKFLFVITAASILSVGFFIGDSIETVSAHTVWSCNGPGYSTFDCTGSSSGIHSHDHFVSPGSCHIIPTGPIHNSFRPTSCSNIPHAHAPAADFTANKTTVDEGESIQFTDTSTNSPTTWQWDFDNNGTTDSTAKNPTHSYTAPGTYTVKLTASNSGGSDSETKVNYITVNAVPPSVAITNPAAGSWQIGNFTLSYDANFATNCRLETRDGASGTWINRGAITCGAGQTTTIQTSTWCPTQGSNECGVNIVVSKGALSDEDSRDFSIDITAPTVTNFTVTDGATTVDNSTQPLITSTGSLTLNWGTADSGSGVNYSEVWRTTDSGGAPDPANWIQISGSLSAGVTSFSDTPGGGTWWYGIHVIDNAANCITETGGHCGGVTSDSQDPRAIQGPLRVIVDNIAPTIVFDTPPTPAAGSVHSTDFTIQYDAVDNISTAAQMTCELFISTNGGTAWASRGNISCGVNQNTSVQWSWCPAAGSDQCGVRIQATDAIGNTANLDRFYTFNQEPSVTVMSDTSTPITDPFTLLGTVSDDGFLSLASLQWTQESGPAPATINTPNAEDTDVSFSTIGTYVFRLTANDGFFTSFDEVTITVNHEMPTANAGPDQTIQFGLPSVSTTLDGNESTDDGFPGPLTYSWSGPSGATFSAPSAAVTTVTFTSSGVYDIALEVSDGDFSDTDIMRVTVQNNPPIIDAGLAQTIAFGLPVFLSGTATDDGLPNPPPGNTLTISWAHVDGPGTATFTSANSLNTEVQFTQAGAHELRLSVSDGEHTSTDTIEIDYGAPENYGLVPCGINIDDPSTPWNETETCGLRHTLLLLRNVIDFTLWKLAPLIIGILAAFTGALMYFSFGSPTTLARVKSIWGAIGKGVLILLLSWLFLNFFLGVLGFDITIYGTWYEVSV